MSIPKPTNTLFQIKINMATYFTQKEISAPNGVISALNEVKSIVTSATEACDTTARENKEVSNKVNIALEIDNLATININPAGKLNIQITFTPTQQNEIVDEEIYCIFRQIRAFTLPDLELKKIETYA